MTFEVILIEIKYLLIHNISVHINFYQNRFINESVRKNFLKISEGKTERRKDVKTERRSFFVSCRNYVLNNNQMKISKNYLKIDLNYKYTYKLQSYIHTYKLGRKS